MNNEKISTDDKRYFGIIVTGSIQLIGELGYDEDDMPILKRPLVFGEGGTPNQQTGQLDSIRPVFRKLFLTLDVSDQISISGSSITYIIDEDKPKDMLLIQAYKKHLQVCDADAAGIVTPDFGSISNINKFHS